MLITTTADPAPHTELRALRLAEELGAKLVARSNRSLNQLMRTFNDPEIWIAGERDLRYKKGSDDFMFFHPSMAMIRVKRMLAGEPDTMLEAAGIEEGNSVMDCTMGLASDAVVFAAGVGEAGQVVALESERVPYMLAKEGLQTYECGFPLLEAAMRRVIPINSDHLAYLKEQPDNSADVVYFDPMFRRSAASSAIEPLRELANSAALRREAIEQAVRVARKSVVMKEHNRSGEFERLGFRPIHTAQTRITYGVIRL